LTAVQDLGFFGFVKTPPFALSIGIACSILVASCAAPEPKAGATGAKRTVWVPATTGSLLGGGYYADVSGSDTPSDERVALNDAVTALNLHSQTPARLAVALPAISQQAGVRTEVLRAQHESTKMMYGDLLVANVAAKATGKSVEDVIAVRTKKKDWAEAAGDLHVSVSSLATAATRAHQAVQVVRAGGGDRRHITGEGQVRELGITSGTVRPGG
jgi:hypothetical protein